MEATAKNVRLFSADDFIDNVQHVVDFVLETEFGVDNAQYGMSLPCGDEVVIHHAGQFQGLGAAVVVLAGIELFGAFGGGADVEHSLITFVAQGFCGTSDRIHHVLPHIVVHIGRRIHRAPVANYQGRLVASGSNPRNAIFHDHLELQFIGFCREGEIRVFGEEVGTSLNKEGGGFGQGEHRVTQVGVFVLYPFENSGFAGARAACEDDSGDFWHSREDSKEWSKSTQYFPILDALKQQSYRIFCTFAGRCNYE